MIKAHLGAILGFLLLFCSPAFAEFSQVEKSTRSRSGGSASAPTFVPKKNIEDKKAARARLSENAEVLKPSETNKQRTVYRSRSGGSAMSAKVLRTTE